MALISRKYVSNLENTRSQKYELDNYILNGIIIRKLAKILQMYIFLKTKYAKKYETTK